MTSDGIVAKLTPILRSGDRVLLLRADIAPGALPAALAAAGAEVEDVAAYRTVPDLAGREAALRLLAAGQIDVVTLTSGSTVRNLVAALDGQRALLERPLLACIGPVTAEAARDLGLRVDLVAPIHTIDGLIEALVQRFAPEPREVAP